MPSSLRRTLLQIAIALAVVLLATAVLPRFGASLETGEVGLVGSGWSVGMANEQADVLFLGNSLVEWGVDVDRFEQLSGRNAQVLWARGSAGGWWYLILDRIVTRAERRPGLVVLCFNDDALTVTALVNGEQALDRITSLLDEEDWRAGTGDRVERTTHGREVAFLTRHWPLAGARSDARKSVETAVKGYVAAISGEPREQIDERLARVFDLAQKDAEIVDRDAEATAVDLRFYDFHRIKEHSFLPDILSVAERNRIPIVFVRMPRRVTRARRADLPQEVALRSYVTDLAGYLEQRGYPFVDLSSLSDLGPDDFEVGDHLSPSGRDLFTPVLHAALAPHLPARAFVAATK